MDVLGLALGPSTTAADLGELVGWRLTAGAGGGAGGSPPTVRPTLGHRLVILIEDVSACARAHAPVDGGGVAPPGLAGGAGPGAGGPASGPSDLEGVAAAAGGAAWPGGGGGSGGGAACEVAPPCLEWVRQLADCGRMVGGYSGLLRTWVRVRGHLT